MKNLISFIFLTLLSLNIYSQQVRLPEYPGGEKAFEEYLTKGISLPDTINTEVYSFQLNVYANGKIELAESNTWFSDCEVLDSQFLELIKKMPQWEIKDTGIGHLIIKGNLSFSPDGVTLSLKVTSVSNLITIDEILARDGYYPDKEKDNTDNKSAIDIKELKVTKAIVADKPSGDNRGPYVTVEQMPLFPGGEAKLMQFLSENLKIPIDENRAEGTCTRINARFVVEADGSISNIQVLRDCGEKSTMAIIEGIKKMPKWIPGNQNGRNVAVYVTLPIHLHFKR